MEEFHVDAHFHIWDLNKFDQDWIGENEQVIARNFSADEYANNISETPVKYGVFVQCVQDSPEEALWVLNQRKPYIKGVVAGLSLTDNTKLLRDITTLNYFDEFVGCRAFDPTNDAWITLPSSQQAIQIIGQSGKTFEFMITPHQLKHLPSVLESAPSTQMFLIDHMAKPNINDGEMKQWKEDICKVAKHPNVHCKISGLVTEADLKNWKTSDLQPYVQHVIDVFGPERCMYGSDWPVCLLANSSYKQTHTAYSEVLQHLTPEEITGIFQKNAIKFYNLNV